MALSVTRRAAGAVALVAGLALAGAAVAEGEKIAVITPYLAQPGTQFYVEAFQARATELA